MIEKLGLFTSFNRKVRLYKLAFITCFAVTTLSITTSAVLGAHYWNLSLNGHAETEKTIHKLKTTEQIEGLLLQIDRLQNASKNPSELRSSVLQELSLWLEVNRLRSELGLEAIAYQQTKNPAEARSLVAQELASNREVKIASLNKWQEMQKRTTRPGHLLILVGILTFIFGIALPLMLIYKIMARLNAIKDEIQNTVMGVAAEWKQTLTQFGENSVKNFDFWLDLLLLLLATVSRGFRNPALYLITEITRFIRAEIEKHTPAQEPSAGTSTSSDTNQKS